MRNFRTLLMILALAAVASGFYTLGKLQNARGDSPPPIPPLPKAEVSGAIALQKAFVAVAKRAEPAVVHIRAVREPDPGMRFLYEFFGERVPRNQSYGSGFIFHPEGYILTNFHVIQGASSISVGLPGRDEEVPAELRGRDPWLDLVVLKIKTDRPLPALPLGDSDKIEVGEWAIAIGNPFGLDQTMTVGVISAKGREFESVQGRPSPHSYIQTDALINPGNSGGPLLNIAGEVIGINNFIYNPSGVGVGIGYGFAIPINSAKAILGKLMKGERIVRGGFLGVAVVDADSGGVAQAGYGRRKGAFVWQIVEGSPAYNAGIRPGDVIVRFGGKTIENANQLVREVQLSSPGRQVPIELIRGNQRLTVTVVLGSIS